MQTVFEKIIEKLEEQKKAIHLFMEKNDKSRDASVSRQTLDYAIEIVKQEAEKYNNGWIPCGEQLPEPIRPVLVTLRNWMNDRYFVRVGRFHTDHWRTDEGIVENSVVIAWKPLPEPYQPKGE